MPTHFPFLLDAKLNPEYGRRNLRVPTWETFGNQPQFITLRDLSKARWREELDRYSEEFRLGRIVWPTIYMLTAPHLKEAVAELRRRGLFLFDLWGHVPGSPVEGMWANVTPPPGTVAYLEQELGDHFLGIDNGEQDGRYVWATGQQQCPSAPDRCLQYLMFQRHFQKLCGELGNHMSALVSLCFGHYFLKEGNHVLLGAETAQALPNSQLYYAFIRGAGKQYGVHWFGNASVFNRWGWKDYGPERRDGGYVSGPERGTSLNLLKRLMYTHYLYNCVALGFESGWLLPDAPAGEATAATPAPAPDGKRRFTLTPIGHIQRGAVDFVARHGQPGVMHTPVALLLDFLAGWAPPRHLYTHYVYQVWGGMPYDAGDYLTHGLLSLLYPGYEDASYFRDERGFLTATPFGDQADVLLSDAPDWVLRQYGLVIVAGRLALSCELRHTLRQFVAQGGHLVVTAANAHGLLPGLEFTTAPATICPAGSVVRWQDGGTDAEPAAFALATVTLPPQAAVLARCGEHPAVVEMTHGTGRVTLLLSPFGLPAAPQVAGPVPNKEETDLPCPLALLQHVRHALTSALAAQQLFEVGADLGFVTCRRGAGDYLVGIHNNTLASKPFRIKSRCGELRAVEELMLDQAEKGAVGYWPTGMSANNGGTSNPEHIAGGDIRLFAVRVQEQGVTCLSAPCPPPLPRNRFLALNSGRSIQEEILRRPTFFRHFDGVKVDGRYLRDRDREQLRRECDWLTRQRVRLAVDLSPLLNLYPDLTLINNHPPHAEDSAGIITNVLEKMALLGSTVLIVTLHRGPENHWQRPRVREEFIAGLRTLCQQAATHGITVNLQAHPQRWATTTAAARELVEAVAAPNLRVAVNIGHLTETGDTVSTALKTAGDRLGCILYAAPQRDLFGQSYDAHLPIHTAAVAEAPVAAVGDTLHILDALYTNPDDEFLDCQALWHSTAWPGDTDPWHGFTRHRFTIGGCAAWVVEPHQPLAGKPWSWCLEFPDAFTERCAAVRLLEAGFHHVHLDRFNNFGAPAALELFSAYYELLTWHGLAKKAVLIGVSRGGLSAYRWAAENPDKVAVIYGDAPVCDFKSWPGGKGVGPGSPPDWECCQRAYGFKAEADALAYTRNPVDNLAPLARAGVALIHVVGDADEVVPVSENTAILEQRYRALGGTIEVIHKPGIGHHPHGLEDPAPVVDFILRHR